MTRTAQTQDEAIAAADALAAENATRPSARGGRRMAEIAGGMGKKIETIAGQDVLVTAITFDTRSIHSLNDDPDAGVKRGDLVDREVAFIEVAPQVGFEDHGPEQYYTWSAPLIEKLRAVAAAEDGLPSVANFNKIDLADGRTAWTIS
jgi:hypothetical protein